MIRLSRALIPAFLIFSSLSSNAAGKWRDWSEDLFKKAKAENKLVILDLEAVWCHWCHVMHEQTYANTKVQTVLNAKFIQVRVDQDSRPDLASRYEDYGWPATIIFTPDGKEIVKKSGFIPPDEMTELLNTVVKDPTPPKEEFIATTKSDGSLTPQLVTELKKVIEENYDSKLGAWDIGNKFLDADFGELMLVQALKGDAQSKARLLQTLDAQLKIQDPVWGGFYQYSAKGVWSEPHFEKIMLVQTDNIRVFSQAFLYTGKPEYLEAAKKAASYLKDFLSAPDGAFYTSQDADLVPGQHSSDYFDLNDKKRRARGVPRVDKHIYARENGWAIQGLVSLYSATSDKVYLERAVKAARWIAKNRSLPGGGFRHDGKDVGGPYLNDSLQMGAAQLRLYSVTGDREWLKESEKTMSFIAKTFAGSAGYISAVLPKDSLFKPSAVMSENIQLARYANLLFRYIGAPETQAVSQSAMKHIARLEVARGLFTVSGVLLAGLETGSEPTHLTLVGAKSDTNASELWSATSKFPLSYQRTEWWDRREGPLAKGDVTYPDLPKPAVFVCTSNRCSLPAFDKNAVQRQIETLKSGKKG